MSSKRCEARTKSGERCKLLTTSGDFCHLHDPEKIELRRAEREKTKRRAEAAQPRMPARLFSERKGYVTARDTLQLESMSDELRAGIWNVLRIHVFDIQYEDMLRSDEFRHFARRLWADFFRVPIEGAPANYNASAVLHLFKIFKEMKWHRVYDFVEYVLNYPNYPYYYDRTAAVKALNLVLERESSGYRFVGNTITDITSDIEIAAIEAVATDESFAGAQEHIRCALELLSDRENPDYRNSIKESISAVESMAQVITNNPKTTLGAALKALERNGEIHGSLKSGLSSLYGYTSDEGGIRHAMLEEPNVTADDARFFLVVCSAFVNYLKSKASL